MLLGHWGRVCVLDNSIMLALFLSVMLILWSCGESSCPGACGSEMDQESKSMCVCMLVQSRRGREQAW